jgi:hypothetical protein
VSIYPTHWRVWEWTNTCFAPVALEPAGEARMTNTNCGVRVASSAIPAPVAAPPACRLPISVFGWWPRMKNGLPVQRMVSALSGRS